MKKQILYRIAISALFLFFGRLAVSAEPLEYLMTIDVPFDFQVNDQLLPAGKYVIKRDQQSPQILLIEGLDRNIRAIVHTIPHKLTAKAIRTSLVFKGYGERHFLSEVRTVGRDDGYALIRSKEERRLAQNPKTKTGHSTIKDATTDN